MVGLTERQTMRRMGRRINRRADAHENGIDRLADAQKYKRVRGWFDGLTDAEMGGRVA